MQTETKSSEFVKLYVDDNMRTVVTCRSCGLAKSVSAAPYISKNRWSIRIRCNRCGTVCVGGFELRKHYRKKTLLLGVFRKRNAALPSSMIVEDISLRGIGFTAMRPDALGLGDIVSVDFQLDDSRRTRIQRDIEVVFKKNGFFGAKFVSIQSLDKELGYYLMP